LKNKKKIKVIGLLFIISILVVSTYIIIQNMTWKKLVMKQEMIHSSPEEILTIIEDSKYTIEQVEYNYPSPDYETAKDIIKISILYNNVVHQIQIIQTPSWEDARSSTMCCNRHTCGAIEEYAFFFGDLLIVIYPENKTFGKELEKLIESKVLGL